MDMDVRSVKVVTITETNLLKLISLNDDNSVLNETETIELDLGINANVDAILHATRSTDSLISLTLSHCNLNYIPEAFRELQLNELDLSHNSFDIVPKCIINGLECMRLLDFSYNRLTFFDEPKCFKKLRVLLINNNYFENIPDWVLKVRSFNLQELNYSMNFIGSLKECQFLQVPSYELRKLVLRSCTLRHEDITYLKNVKRLKHLDLSNEMNKFCNILNTCDDLFNQPRWNNTLKELHLNYLNIANLPEEISQLEALEELHVAYNYLFWLPNTIVLLSKLRLINLSHNKLVCLPIDMYKMQNLQILELANNCLSTISEPYPPSLILLDLYHNLIESFDLKPCEIKIDVEMNLFNTCELGEKYLDMKNSLRADLQEIRCNGQKVIERCAEEIDAISLGSTSESEEDDKECRTVERYSEESWNNNDSIELAAEGCTLSDNEWTGFEKVPVPHQRKKLIFKEIPSWMFEDV
ncbi:hypothetical protein FQA39_LY17761 [Lamprigera yunnana]|nr:hypothetical protein FQA39_LY17761 [Lamprigera yunnana]